MSWAIKPVISVPGACKRFPCFWFRQDMTVLPAFPEFIGGSLLAPSLGDRIVACVQGDAVLVQSGSVARL